MLIKKITKFLINKIKEKNARKLCNSFDALPRNNGITLVDVGAAGDLEPRWKNIESKINYIGFEPDNRSRELLINRNTACKSYQIYPSAIWSEDSMIEINLCT